MSKKQPLAKPPAPIEAPAMPAETEEELADSRRLIQKMREVSEQLHRRNLHSAVLLAQQAVSGRGPLVDHFAELGRRFGPTLNEPPQRPKLRLITGGG